MLNSVNLMLVAFNRVHSGNMVGQMFAFFIIAVAAAEVAVGLAIIVAIFRRRRGGATADDIDLLRG
jgi:NADH-quinone oxidoreductase subunit K